MATPGVRRRAGEIVRKGWFQAIAGAVAIAAIVTGAIAGSGYDVTQTKVDDSSVWALQSGQGDRYARVNTSLGQLDTVKQVSSPSDLAQTAGHVMVFSQNDAKVASVSLSQPSDLTDAASGFSDTPPGTTSVVHAGDYVAYLTGTGAVYGGRVSAGAKGQRTEVKPAAGKGHESYSADAIAVGVDGIVYSYSHTAGAVLRFDLRTGRPVGTDAVRGGPTRPGSSLTVVGDSWVLLAAQGTTMWIAGLDHSVSTGLGAQAVLQQSSAAQKAVLAADPDGLRAFALQTGKATVLARGSGLGTPAAPMWQANHAYAAWLPLGAGPGTFWSGKANLDGAPAGRTARLSYGNDGSSQGGGQEHSLDNPQPSFRSNGSRVILNDTTSGWVWAMPDGALVQGSQNWELSSQTTSEPTQTVDQNAKVTDPEPPVAENDHFGVRAGSLVTLPVMLNDHDPNEDVLTIIPDSVQGLDPAFGSVVVANGAQTITLQVKANPPPTASFSYEITDGTTADGLNSEPATVTLDVHGAGVNGAPQPCGGNEPCLVSTPQDTQVAPGSTVSVPLLRGWVDPDGDPVFATSLAASPDYTASVSPSGTIVFQAHPNAPQGTVSVPVEISDVFGATVQQLVTFRIQQDPALAVDNFGLMTAVGVPLTVDPSSHIRGAVGTPKITSATTTSPELASVSVDSAGATFGFTATATGSYPIAMTVVDPVTGDTQTATVRIVVVGADQPLLSTAPVTVFVRPQTDTSVDVFNAVQNPTGRVLLLSDPKPQPATGASLDVDVVGESQLRVRGTTGDEQPGLLGTVGYTVSDGTHAANLTVQGVATVYLLPDAQASTPVAVNDSVTVRAGAQIDIPVLANDVGPNGDTVELDPASITDQQNQGLAFASGQLLRYLAPTTPGTVTLGYGAYSAGNPTGEARATVTVTVLPLGGNRPPQPVTLTGRVIAGASVRIPFNGYGIDPDGDTVALDRILSQPQDGSAEISADGSAIIYTSVAGTRRQESFTYQVRDAFGETGQATVFVGVLDAQSDPAPVTFSDYVQVQAGAGNQVVVQPAANDIDPAGGSLKVDSVVPNAIQDSAQFELLKEHLKSTSDSSVVITATDTPRTLTYNYSVSNAAGDVAAGLIVVKVVTGHVNDYPLVQDTVVSAQQRDQLGRGIDVVTGKVSWGAGDASSLKLSLWGKHDGVEVSGDDIKVTQVDESGMLIPFKLSGTDFTGKAAFSYGFLRVPALSDVILALKSDARTQKVKEGGKVSFDMADLVTVPTGSALTVQQSGVHDSGTRQGASCDVSGTTITYTAGTGAPWIDSCRVPVRLVGQQNYTLLAVPIDVIPLQPEPELRPASLTASPGAANKPLSFDLTQMTTWLSHPDMSGLHYTVSYSGSLFRVTQDGQTITVAAKDDSRPGLEEQATVTIDGHPGPPTAVITLKVGPAPSTRPAGGSLALNCSEANGSSCSATVVGLSDEVNAYSTPLKVVSVQSQVSGCTGVTFAVSDARTITASWADAAPGGSCTVPFAVEDAQGKRSAVGAGDGTLSFQLQGYPAAPSSVAQVGYGESSVTLAVTPGDASAAYPALSGFRIYVDGKASVECTAAGVCPPVTGLVNGDKHSFTARAVNSVGESKSGPSTTGWAFAQPTIGSISAKPVYDAQRTSATSGWFTLSIPNSDKTTSQYQVSVSGAAQAALPVSGGDTTTATYSATPGQTTTVTVTPVSRFSVPPGQATDAQPASTSVVTAGTPSVGWSSLPASFTTSSSSITVQGSEQANRNGGGGGNPASNISASGDSSVFLAVTPQADPGCTFNPDSSSNPIGYNAAGSSSSQTIGGLNQFSSYDVYVCYSNGYGVSEQKLNGDPVIVWDQSSAPTPSGCSYSITDQRGELPDYEYGSGAPSCDSGQQRGAYTLNISGSDTGTFGQRPSFSAKYCALGNLCGASTSVDPTSDSAPFQMRVTSVAPVCSVGSDGTIAVSVSPSGDGLGAAAPSPSVSAYQYLDPSTGQWVDHSAAAADPPGVTQVRNIRYHLAWGTPGFAPYDGRIDGPVSCPSS